MRDLTDLIEPTNATHSARYTKALLDRMMFAGDPLADRAVAALHERNYDRAADKLSAVRALAADGDDAAGQFVGAVARPPGTF